MANRRPLHSIQLTEVQQNTIKREISAFYEEETGESMSAFKADEYLDFVMDHIAPVIYNRALEEARRWFSESLGSLESEYYTLYKNE